MISVLCSRSDKILPPFGFSSSYTQSGGDTLANPTGVGDKPVCCNCPYPCTVMREVAEGGGGGGGGGVALMDFHSTDSLGYLKG